MTAFVRRHRHGLAIAGSLLLHAVIIIFLIMPASGALSTLDLRALGDTRQTGIDVELVQPVTPGPKPMLPKASRIQTFLDMTERQAKDGWKAQPAKPATSISDLFGKDLFAESPRKAQTTQQSPTDQHVRIKDSDRHSMNDLWKAIEPCWRRVADDATLDVTLSVSFSPLGKLSKPPVIVRDPAAPLTGQRLRSESLAISALAECGPYMMAFGQSDVKVLFPAGG